MAKPLEVVVGGSLEEDAADVAAAWRAAESGARVEPTDRVSFIEWDSFASIFTPKRLHLLRHLRHAASPIRGVRPLARELDRDVRRVHEDVTALAALGLVERHKDGSLSTPLDEVGTIIRIKTDRNGFGQSPGSLTPA